jgi:hypothetical protein
MLFAYALFKVEEPALTTILCMFSVVLIFIAQIMPKVRLNVKPRQSDK